MASLSKSRKGQDIDGNPLPLSMQVIDRGRSFLTRQNRWGISARELLGALGPGFLISVGYMDPGNWGTNLSAGAGFGYQLLWVILASNIIAIVLQIASSKLGIATNKNLAQLIREQFPRPMVYFLGITSVMAILATDLAEIFGGMLGFNILFGIPLFPAALLTGLLVMGLLALSRFGYRKIEFVIIGLVSVIGLVYLYETLLLQPDWGSVVFHTFIPQFSSGSIMVAVGILGATVMPHNVFLHSFLAPQRLSGPDASLQERHKILTLSKFDTITALNVAFFVNAAMVVVAGTVFFHRVSPDALDLTTADATLTPILGSLAGLAFGIGLLASGLASSTTGTLAGQVVFEGFFRRSVPFWLWRTITMVPALTLAALNVPGVSVLVISQVALSMQLPFTMAAVLSLSCRRDLMGDFTNTRWVTIMNALVTVLVTCLNIWLLLVLIPLPL
jgi:NRAMP (natural resistance-associated macrophage protein) metal ion transporters